MIDGPSTNPEDPQRRIAGLPYDFRPPTLARVRSRLWNAHDPRLFTPKAFGIGYDLNFYWLLHPTEYIQNRSG